jgi:hypothetical protein
MLRLSGGSSAKRVLKVTDPFSSQKIEIPVDRDSFNANYFSKLKTSSTTPASLGEEVPIRLFDSGFKNTAGRRC